MNNIQKAFKTKSKLRGMADGGQVDPRVIGSGMAQRAVSTLQGRRAQLDAAIDAASGAPPPRPAPTVPVTAAPAKKPEEKSALRSFFGLADGGSPADVDRIMNSRDMSIFTPQEIKQFNAMGQAAMAHAAQMQDVGVQAGQAALAAARPAELPADMAPPEIELADGGKVKGKGSPTDDKVGPVALSDGEYVLPADTVKIVGRENLDALRLATHDFVDEDNKPNVSGLRKMANGGTFYVDPEGVVNRGQMPPGRAMVPYQPSTAIAAPRAPIEGTATRVPPTAAAAPPAATAAEVRNVSGAAGAANPAATSSLRTAINSGGGRVGSFVRGALPVAAISGVVDSFADVGSGYRDKFNESIGATGPVSSVAGDAARVMGNVGDAITFGLAGRLGRGLSNLTSGQSFTEGFMSESDREQMQRVMGQQAPTAAAAPYQPSTAIATRVPPGRAVAPYQPPTAIAPYQPPTAMGPYRPPTSVVPSRVIDGEFSRVTPRAAQPALAAPASAAPASAAPASAAPASAAPASAAPARPSIGSRLRSVAGRGLAGLGGIYAVSDGVGDMADRGITATNVGDTASGVALLAQAAGRAHPVAAAAGTGWMIGRAIGDNMGIDAQDAVGGAVNKVTRGTGQILNKGLRAIGVDTDIGADWGVDDPHYLESKKASGGAVPQPVASVQPRSTALPGMSNVPADVRTSSAGMPATPVQPQSYQSRRLAEMGVPVDQQNLAPVTEDTRRSLLRKGGGTPGQYVNLGSYGGDANIYGTASKPGGRINSFAGVGASSRPGGGPQEDPIMGEIRSALRGLTENNGSRSGGAVVDGGNAREINARYDKMANQLSGMYGPKGQGNLARRLLELEQSRSGALDADVRNQSALRGQDVQAATVANSASLQARMQALQTLGTMANQRSQRGAQAQAAADKAQAAQLKALQDAQAAARQGEEKGFERYNGAISSMFVGPDGKPDAADQERFTSFLQASDPQAQQKFTAMSPQDQMVLLQNFKTLYDMQKARNATAESGGGAITNRADMPVDVREATWNDHWNNNLPLSDYVWSNLPFTNPNVAVTESGQPVLMSDYATTDGNWDADKLEMIRQRTGKDREGRSALRGN